MNYEIRRNGCYYKGCWWVCAWWLWLIHRIDLLCSECHNRGYMISLGAPLQPHLGQLGPPRITDEQLEAIAGLKNSWEHLEDFQRWVKTATPTTFEAIRRITTDKVVAELNWLNAYVVGKSGSTEMEALLVDAWAKLSASVSQPLPEI